MHALVLLREREEKERKMRMGEKEAQKIREGLMPQSNIERKNEKH